MWQFIVEKFLWEPQKLKWKRTFKIEKKTFKKQFFQMSSSKAYFLQKHLMKLGLARSYIIFWLGHWSNQSLKLCPFNLYMSATYLFLLLESWKFDRDAILVIDLVNKLCVILLGQWIITTVYHKKGCQRFVFCENEHFGVFCPVEKKCISFHFRFWIQRKAKIRLLFINKKFVFISKRFIIFYSLKRTKYSLIFY